MIGTRSDSGHNVFMCSRYEIDIEWEEIVERFGLSGRPEHFMGCEIRPTDPALIVKSGGVADLANWGIPAPWDDRPLINAREESLKNKPTFRPLLENRCLVPASAYFEWRREGGQRLKNRISLEEGEILAFAGLYSGDSFSIVTCEPSPSIAHIHNRMPVILPNRAENDWCDNAIPFDDVRLWLKPFEANILKYSERKPPQRDLFTPI